MNWFLIALGAPFLWAFVNIVDKYLVAKYSKGEQGSGGLVLFSSLVGIFVAIIILAFTPQVLDIPLNDKLLLLLAGVLTIVWVILYLFSLELEDVSKVAPWFLTVPIFGYIFSYIFLGETLTFNQQLGSIITLGGVFLISINFQDKYRFKRKPVIYMIIACVLIAIMGIIFKYVTVEDNFWVSSFWEYLGLGITGILIYLFVPKYRKEFMYMNKKGGKKIFTLNVVSELVTITGNLLTNFALLLAPVTMVYLVGSFQPAILLVLSIVGTVFFPKIIKEDISKNILIQKIVAVIVMIVGSVMLFS